MAEDRLLCFSTSKRGHCISFLVPFSILHCQSVPKHNPNTGWSFLRDQETGQRSTNTFSILHFHCQPQPQRHSNNTSAAAHAARELRFASPFSIPLPEANQQQVNTVCSTRDVTRRGSACGKKFTYYLTIK